MRKINVFMMIATSVLAIASCNKEMNEPAAKQTAKTIRFVANPVATKTTFGTPDGTTYPVYWNEGDLVKFKIASNTIAAYDEPVVPSADRTTATFDIDLTRITGPTLNLPYIFRFISPASATPGFNSYVQKRWGIVVPEEQTPSANSVDPSAQILEASTGFDKTVVDSVYKLPEVIDLDFRHVTAYGRFSITNCTPSSEVSFVKLTFAEPVAGKFNYFDGIDPSTGNRTADPELTAYDAKKSIYINTSSLQNIWFACAPAAVAGTELKIEVVMGEKEYAKTITLGATNNLVAGRIASFSVNFSGITTTDYVEETEPYYSIVTSTANLSDGDQILIVNTTANRAVPAAQNGANAKGVDISSYLLDDGSFKTPGPAVMIFTLGVTDNGYTFQNSDETYYGADGTFKPFTDSQDPNHTISIDSNGDATIERGAYRIMYNPGTNVFNAFVANKRSDKNPVQIFKKVE